LRKPRTCGVFDFLKISSSENGDLSTMEHWPDWLKHSISVGVGIAIIIFVLWRLSPLIFFRFRAHKAPGRITNWMSMKEKGKTYFYPIIEFETNDGRSLNYRAEERCENRPMYPVGTEVTVLYDRKNPKNARTNYPEAN
jgi:hypothetical protein